MNKRVAIETLRLAAHTLDGLRLCWWLDCGALLGAIREGGFLEHDDDIDLGVWGVDGHVETRSAFVAAGFDIAALYGTPEYGLGQSFRRKNVKVDLLYFYPHQRGAWQGSWVGQHCFESVFAQQIVPPLPHEFNGVDCYVPADPEGMLAARYGDWRTVVTEWDWSTDPKCITPETRRK